MKELTIKLTSIADVQDFVGAVAGYNGDVDLKSGRYVVDGKSIMGIFSLDLMQPVTMEIHGENADELIARIEKYIVA